MYKKFVSKDGCGELFVHLDRSRSLERMTDTKYNEYESRLGISYYICTYVPYDKRFKKSEGFLFADDWMSVDGPAFYLNHFTISDTPVQYSPWSCPDLDFCNSNTAHEVKHRANRNVIDALLSKRS